MFSVWKFELTSMGPCSLLMPEGAEILTIGEQGGGLHLWARVNTEAPLEERRFWVAGTGHSVPGDPEIPYLGTAFFAGGALVWHVFEVPFTPAGAPSTDPT